MRQPRWIYPASCSHTKKQLCKSKDKNGCRYFDDFAALVPLLARQPDAKDRWGQKTSLREHSSASIGTFFFVTTAVATTPYTMMIQAIMAKSSRLCLGQRQLAGSVTRVVTPKSPMDGKHHRNRTALWARRFLQLPSSL